MRNEEKGLIIFFLVMLILAFIALIYSLLHSESISSMEFYSVSVTLFGALIAEFVALWKSFSDVKYKLGRMEGKFDQYLKDKK